MDDGRLGMKKTKKGQMKVQSKNSSTHVPQRLQFTDDHIDSIYSAGSIAYCTVSGSSDLERLGLDSGFNTRTYIWGKCAKGLTMERVEKVLTQPTVFK